ncbi:MAG: glycosyltransferase family 4 protein [Deltaproteobacteria bacterium]|nr:glycosyltransferase family 4 protein [Deltaproteobacteria bacterium]MBW1919389.1 glycosyltransferase family 4 protein [Deltaproteobacteria bacterium]MBW1934474.1 glycosyltransferase family 4 protein [Deltaproteobacteria bacterium]MBW1978066.1 glycosyltransferase family 4 protein [Deltaproteobacteria bacterium]MBW2301254.1 glycosyltransferase family 4 protein [Deltaproteobacteria bacterium]
MNSNAKEKKLRILVDAREFVPDRFTGIGRVLKGLTYALANNEAAEAVALAAYDKDLIPAEIRNSEKVIVEEISRSFLLSEKRLSSLTRKGFDVFISPYPKLPLFGCHCKSIHIIHDILDLTHPAYRRRFKVLFDEYRLKRALRKADLTWYDSTWSLKETKKYAGFAGKNPRVRYPGIDEKFRPEKSDNENRVLEKYNLDPGYILVVGNGLPHKNLGVLLSIAKELERRLVFMGVPPDNQGYWMKKFPQASAVWIKHAAEEELPPLMQAAFCLAQPSTAEGYGYPPLEAMACGTPAVVSNIPVLVETTGGNALSAPPDDLSAWLNSFRKLEDNSTYSLLVEKGLKWVEPLQGDRAWEGYLSDIKELLERN